MCIININININNNQLFHIQKKQLSCNSLSEDSQQVIESRFYDLTTTVSNSVIDHLSFE